MFLGFFPQAIFFVNHSRYFHFQYLCFHQAIINDQDFSVAIAFCLLSSPSTVRPICFSLSGLVSVRKETLRNDLGKLVAGSSCNGTKWSIKSTKKSYSKTFHGERETNKPRKVKSCCMFIYIKYNLTNAY